MTAILTAIGMRIFAPIMALVLLISPGAALSGETIRPLDKGALKMNFSVLADTHIETFEMFRFQYLRNALRDIGKAQVRSDALVLLGDNTMNGQITEYTMLYSILSFYNKSRNTLAAMGNHDVNPSQNTIEAALAKHNAFYNGYTLSCNKKPYYSREINGYTFVILGSEGEKGGTDAVISAEQIAWLDQTLAKAARSGKPIFLFNHQPFNDKVHFPDEYPNREDGDYWYNFSGMGDASDAVFDVVKKYGNVIFFYGHVHAWLGVCETEGVTLVNVPPFTAFTGGNGCYVEVYEDKVELRWRAYADGLWVEDETYTVTL